MGKASCVVDFKFPDLEGALIKALPRLERVIASTIQTQVGLKFDAEGAYNGHDKWKSIKRQGQILSLTGNLRHSYSPPSSDGSPGQGGYVTYQGTVKDLLVEVGSNIIYAGIHDQGGTIKWPGTNKGFGKGITIPPHDIVIPKRNVTDLNQKDLDELNETIANLVAEVLSTA